jgi:hypothetical protein
MYYPQILLPQPIKEVIQASPPQLPLPPKPQKPSEIEPDYKKIPPRPEPYKPIAVFIVCFLVAVVGLLLPVHFAIKILIISLALLTALGYIATLYNNFFYYRRLDNWRKKQQDIENWNEQEKIKVQKLNKQKIKDYHQQLNEYNQNKREIEQANNSPKKPKEYLRLKLKLYQEFKTAYKYDYIDSNPKEGRCEPILRERLNHYFRDKIYVGVKMQNPNFSSGYAYTPDFTYVDNFKYLNEKVPFYIDIEVDEPYYFDSDIKDNSPCHYIGLVKDETRNKFFLDRGWIVIRFAEEQVAIQADSCCKELAKLISQITLDDSIVNNFRNIPDLDQVSMWTEEEAYHMIEKKYRDRY